MLLYCIRLTAYRGRWNLTFRETLTSRYTFHFGKYDIEVHITHTLQLYVGPRDKRMRLCEWPRPQQRVRDEKRATYARHLPTSVLVPWKPSEMRKVNKIKIRPTTPGYCVRRAVRSRAWWRRWSDGAPRGGRVHRVVAIRFAATRPRVGHVPFPRPSWRHYTSLHAAYTYINNTFIIVYAVCSTS